MRTIRRLLHTSSTYLWAWVLLVLTSAGIALSMIMAPSSDWMGWHLSRLGEGTSLSAALFNFTFLIAAVLFTMIATRLFGSIEQQHRHSGAPRARLLFLLIALCWVGIAAFPNDRFFVIHNLFGYGQFLLISILMLRLEKICSFFSQRTYAIGYMTAIVVGLLLAYFHVTHDISLLIVELVGQLTFYLWLLSLTYDHSMKGMKHVTK